mgnify:CR=1 FL=1
MAITSSAKKANRVAARKQVFNLRRKRAMKSAVKEVVEGVAAGTKETQALLTTAYKAIDKAAKRGVIKKNTADRKKSRIARMVAKKEDK